MFSSCLGNTRERGSDLNKDESGGHGGGRSGAWRQRARSWLQVLWPFGRKERNLSQGSQGSQGSLGIQGNQGSQGSQGSLGIQGNQGSQGSQSSHGSHGSQAIQVQGDTDQVGVESAPEELNESPRMPHFGPLEQMSALLVTSLQGGDSFFVFLFYCIHQKFLTTQHVLDLLFKRYTSFRPDSEEDERVKYTIYSLLDYWINKFPEEFCRIEHLPILKRVKDYLSVNMPSSDLLVLVQYIQEYLLSQVASDSGASDEEASGSTTTSPPRDAGLSNTPVCNLRPEQQRLRRSSAPSVLTSNGDGYSGARSSLCTGAGEHTTDTRFCDPCAAGATCGSSSGLIATH
ncbi:uncharacterized protein LOC121135953 [Mesocricetus auratus]|uniref:Uncharacterized protein LOC121135953 n=1 Tax=Mesocricetus auratus TaxID=10036 RepID=A0ABM2WKE1_MESAU|nr:uncharacterized protein LOC121135953 [Mesocricetus auratus]